MTADEIAAALDLEAYVVRKRLPDPLERRGLVVAINRDTMARGDVLRWMVR
jgi:predicted ArsR family transcriptional regulator